MVGEKKAKPVKEQDAKDNFSAPIVHPMLAEKSFCDFSDTGMRKRKPLPVR